MYAAEGREQRFEGRFGGGGRQSANKKFLHN
jgi:hypothetical protein